MFGIYITPFQSFLVCWSAVDATHNGDVGLPVAYCLYRVIDQCWTSPTAILECLPRQNYYMAASGRPRKASKLFTPVPRHHISVTKIAIGADGNTSTSTSQFHLSSRSSAGHTNIKPTSMPPPAPDPNLSIPLENVIGNATRVKQGFGMKTQHVYHIFAVLY